MLNTICICQCMSLGPFPYLAMLSIPSDESPQIRIGCKISTAAPLTSCPPSGKRNGDDGLCNVEKDMPRVASFFSRLPQILAGPWEHCQSAHRTLHAACLWYMRHLSIESHETLLEADQRRSGKQISFSKHEI